MKIANARRRRSRWLVPAATLPALVAVACTGAWAQRDTERPAAEARLPGLVATDSLFRTPTAYIQRDRELTVFGVGDKSANGGALLGFGQRLELGVSAGDMDARSGKFSGSAKLNLLPEALIAPAISVGVLDAFGATHDGRSGYVVVSKYVIPYFVEAVTGQRDISLKFHAGYGSGLYRNRPFVGAEVWGGKGVGGLAEVAAGRVSVGARYYRSGVGATIGLLDLKRVGGGLSYTITLR